MFVMCSVCGQMVNSQGQPIGYHELGELLPAGLVKMGMCNDHPETYCAAESTKQVKDQA